MVIFIAVTVLLGVATVLLLAGKGSFLISGYNTSSAKDKAKYNEKKLCRVMGFGTLSIFLSMLLVCIFGIDTRWTMIVFLVTVFISVIAILLLTNTICYSEEFKQNKQAFHKETKKGSIVTTLTVIGIAIIAFVLLLTGDIKVQYGDTSFTVNASYWPNRTISYDTIDKVTYENNISVGDRTNGVGSFRLNEGKFHNSAYGKYFLYSYVDCKEFVKLDTSDGIIVINGKTPEATKEIYNTLLQKVK
jgi:hypothetical protein